MKAAMVTTIESLVTPIPGVIIHESRLTSLVVLAIKSPTCCRL